MQEENLQLLEKQKFQTKQSKALHNRTAPATQVYHAFLACTVCEQVIFVIESIVHTFPDLLLASGYGDTLDRNLYF